MAERIRVAVQLHPQHADYRDLRRAVSKTEEMGADILYTWDHFHPLYGAADGKHFECWTMLAAWAEATERVDIGALVSCNSYRNPELLADMARTIDHISGGRLILGIGAGWFQRDYDEYGYGFGTPGTRLADLQQALPRIEKRLAKLNPPPTRKIPILIGGGGEQKTLRMTARHADVWHGFGNLETFKHKSAVLDQRCAEIGRDPSEVERSWGVNPARLDVVEALVESGARQLTVGVNGPHYDLGPVADLLAWRDRYVS